MVPSVYVQNVFSRILNISLYVRILINNVCYFGARIVRKRDVVIFVWLLLHVHVSERSSGNNSGFQMHVLHVFSYAARFLSGILDYKVMIDSYVLRINQCITFCRPK